MAFATGTVFKAAFSGTTALLSILLPFGLGTHNTTAVTIVSAAPRHSTALKPNLLLRDFAFAP
jgi:hypothetical protein